MLRALLAKDLRRVRRNPLPWLINLIVPLCMTALIGLAFGGKSDNGALGRIHFAVVDEDKTRLSDLLRGSSSQGDAAKYLDPVFLDRDEALRQINDDKLAAVLIIPTNFTRNYLTASNAVSLELIKNPAQSIHPAVMEELLGALVTAMNALSRNFHADFPELQEVIDGKEDYRKISTLIDREGGKLEALKKYVNPPLVSFEEEVRAGESKSGPGVNLFAYLLLGLAGMFLLFIANNAMTDLHRELRFRTFERYQTMRQQRAAALVTDGCLWQLQLRWTYLQDIERHLGQSTWPRLVDWQEGRAHAHVDLTSPVRSGVLSAGGAGGRRSPLGDSRSTPAQQHEPRGW